MFLRFATRLWGVCDFPNLMLVSCAVFPCFTARIFQTSQLVATKSLLCCFIALHLVASNQHQVAQITHFWRPERPNPPWRPFSRRHFRWPFCRRWTPAKFFCTSWIHLRRGVKHPWEKPRMKNDFSPLTHRGLELCTMYQKFWVIYIYIYAYIYIYMYMHIYIYAYIYIYTIRWINLII